MTVKKTPPMTAGGAIETIQSIKHVCRTLLPPKEQEALRLGLEALKREQRRRQTMSFHSEDLLPGEAEEQKEAAA